MLVGENDMLKVADFGTSRFLEIAAHGTTVIGSPPYMAPEQFHGKAVFASDIYSLGVTMYQMLTGVLPYDTPAPADIGQADVGRAGVAAAAEERRDSQGHQRHRDEGDGAGDRRTATSARPDLLDDVLGGANATRRRDARSRGAPPPAMAARGAGRDDAQSIQSRLRARETPAARFCWQCRKPLHARTRSLPVL